MRQMPINSSQEYASFDIRLGPVASEGVHLRTGFLFACKHICGAQVTARIDLDIHSTIN